MWAKVKEFCQSMEIGVVTKEQSSCCACNARIIQTKHRTDEMSLTDKKASSVHRQGLPTMEVANLL